MCSPTRLPLPQTSSSGSLEMQVGFNKWQLGGEKAPLRSGAVPSAEGSDFWAATVEVPAEAFEVNVVFGDGAGGHDNNQVGARGRRGPPPPPARGGGGGGGGRAGQGGESLDEGLLQGQRCSFVPS
jgi:hypothetical protein